MSDSSYKHILKYTSIFGGVQGLGLAIGIIRNKAIALLLGPAGMGLATLYNSTVVFMTEATNLGIPTSAVRSVSDIYENGSTQQLQRHVASVRVWTLLAACIGFVACILLGPFFSEGSFSYGNHTLNYIMLAPAVSLSIITGGETAILKGARRLRSLVWVQISIMFSALFIAVPIYWAFSYRGVIPVILLSALAQAAITLRFSIHKYPLRLHGIRKLLANGSPMIKLGIAFVLTGVFGKGAEVFIRFFLTQNGGHDAAGLYNAGYLLAVSYASMVFSAMETDYYPRLSVCGDDFERQNKLANRQIEILMLVVAPLLIALMISLPIAMPLLFSSRFLPIVPMAQISVLAMFAKAATMPLAYIPLARSHSSAFIMLEALYAITLCAAIPLGYNYWGLYGTGVAILVANIADFFFVWIYALHRYRFVVGSLCMRHIIVQCTLGVATYITIIETSDNIAAYIAANATLLILSTVYSAHSMLRVRNH